MGRFSDLAIDLGLDAVMGNVDELATALGAAPEFARALGKAAWCLPMLLAEWDRVLLHHMGIWRCVALAAPDPAAAAEFTHREVAGA